MKLNLNSVRRLALMTLLPALLAGVAGCMKEAPSDDVSVRQRLSKIGSSIASSSQPAAAEAPAEAAPTEGTAPADAAAETPPADGTTDAAPAEAPADGATEAAPVAEQTAGISTAELDELMRKKGCAACHKIDTKLIGPAYKDVAAKYAGQADAVEKLAQKILDGGTGVWGRLVMTPNRGKLSEDEARQMVGYILALK